METWGELFWDAWIRLRLACRSLYRTYWPPRFKTWQICTVTGLVSVVLTLFALNYQTAPKVKADTQVADAKVISAEQKKAAKKTPPAVVEDPFADVGLAAETPPAPEQELVAEQPPAPAQTEIPAEEPPDPGFEVAGARKRKKTSPPGDEVAVNEPLSAKPAFEEPLANDQPLVADDAVPAAPLEGAEVPNYQDLDPSAKPAPQAEETPPFAETPPAAAQPVTDEAGIDAALAVEPSGDLPARPAEEMPAEESAAPADEKLEEPAVDVKPQRDPKHYSRLGHHEDNEEERHSVRDIRVAPPAELPPPVTHEPLATPIRSNSHYSRFGHHEDSEEDRHSVRDIRPTRINVVLIPGRDVAQAPAEKSEPMPATDLTPAVPVATAPEPASPKDDRVESEEDIPPFQPTPASPRSDLFGDEPAPVEHAVVPMPVTEQHPMPAEVSEQEPPPVLFAPDTDAAAAERTTATNPRGKSIEYHGPVLSTEAADHEAHQHEDVFTHTKRKTPLLSQPSPDSAAEDVAESVTERNKPVESTTSPRVVPAPAPEPRTAPRVIREHDESLPDVDESAAEPRGRRVVPMAVPDATQHRSPERITVPDRMPSVEPPARPAPRGRNEAAFAIPPTTHSIRTENAPRLNMSITGPRQAPVGTQVIWHFKIQNLGTAPATGIVVSDVLPPGLQHRLSPDLEYTIARLEPGEERETNLIVQCVAPGKIVNRAVLRADGDLSTEAEIEIEVAGSTPTQSAPAVKSPLTVTHHGPERWLVDSTGQFLVTVTNTSSERLRNVTICQSYPKGTNLVHATVGHKVNEVNRTVTWTIADFAPGASYILETELHSTVSGPGTSSVRVKVGETDVAEDRWTAISFGNTVRR